MSVLINSEFHWYCPNCNATDVTHHTEPHSRFHNCAGLHGITAPMVLDGTDCKIEIVEREDYVGKEKGLTYAENKPISAIVTTRADGSNDVAVFPGVATSSSSGVSLNGGA